MFKESIKMSWKNIVQNKMRSFLTVLGILIGVMAIIALTSIVQAVTDSITSDVTSLGGDQITVQVPGSIYKQGITQNELNQIEALDNIAGVSPSISSTTSIVYNNQVVENVSVQGQNTVYFEMSDDVVSYGREINILDEEYETQVCLISQNLVDELFYGANPIDETITINGIRHTIIGVLTDSDDEFSASSTDSTVIIPYTTAMSLLGNGYITSFNAYVEDETLSTETAEAISLELDSIFGNVENAYFVINMQDILDIVDTMTSTMGMLLAGIAAISLVVGGIGIMNMMLVTVTERKKEIGLRKALGATPRTIQLQFVLEALFLSIFGGILGLICGVAVSLLACSIIGVDFTLALYYIPLAIAFSAIIGLVFGYTPAKKASELNPIDALKGI
ncbi:MAG: ABC transporter permease [Clostridia bacterium]